MTTVIVAHRHLMVRQCLEFRLGQERDFRVVGATDRLEDVPGLLRNSSADVLLLDLGLAGDQLEALLDLSRRRPKPRLLVLGEDFDEEQRKQYLCAGVQYLIAESDGLEALLVLIRKLAADTSSSSP